MCAQVPGSGGWGLRGAGGCEGDRTLQDNLSASSLNLPSHPHTIPSLLLLFLPQKVSKHANYNRLLALCGTAAHVDALLAELETLTLEEVVQLSRQIAASCHVEALVHGNLSEEAALQVGR